MQLTVLPTLLLLLAVDRIKAMDNMKVAFEWKSVDYDFASDDERKAAMQSGEFNASNNIPLGLEVYKDRIFITVPRWSTGVPSSLNYIKLDDNKDSPKLHPYPNWAAHRRQPSDDSSTNESRAIVSPFRIRADQFGRLWVLDTGFEDVLGGVSTAEPRLLIYDLHNDQLLRQYIIPADQRKKESFFANIAVEDDDYEDSYAYLGDLGGPGLVVYSWKDKESWVVKHNFFNFDPLAGDMAVGGVSFQWSDGLFGLALAPPLANSSGQGGVMGGVGSAYTLYFHPMNSFHEFAVSTRALRSRNADYKDFRDLGSRGPKSQAGVSFYHRKTHVLFYALVQLNAVACWRATNPAYTMESQGRIYMSNITMVFPNDVKVDANDNLWVISNKLPLWMYGKLNLDEVNFRILTAYVPDAIKGTACDEKLVVIPNIVNKIKPVLMNSNSTDYRRRNDACQLSINFLTVLITSAILYYFR